MLSARGQVRPLQSGGVQAACIRLGEGLSSFYREGNLDVDPVVGDPIVLDRRLHLLNIDRFDVAHRLGGLLNRELRGRPPSSSRTASIFRQPLASLRVGLLVKGVEI